MKMIPVLLGLTMIPVNAMAIERYTSTGLSCAKVQAIIRAEGAAIMSYTSTRVAGLPIYDRYVRSGDFCVRGELTRRAYIPSADWRACPVLRCERVDFVPKER